MSEAASPTMKDHRSLFRQLLAGMYDAVLITDPNGHLLEINPRGKEYFQQDVEAARDQPISLFIPGVTPAMLLRIRKGLDDRRHMMLDAKCLRRDGTTFAAEVTVSEIDLLDAGDLVFTVRNVDRRRRQLAVFRTRENAAAVSQAALFACRPDGAFRWGNAAFLALFGLDEAAELDKLVFADLMGDEPLPALFAQALTGETTSTRIRAEEEGASGGAEIEIQLAPDVHGKKTVGVVGSVFRR